MDEVMGGKVLQLESERLREEGMAIGKAEGKAIGKAENFYLSDECFNSYFSTLLHGRCAMLKYKQC